MIKKIVLLFLSLNVILLSNTLGQEKIFGFTWEKSNNSNFGRGYYLITNLLPYFPADEAGLKKLDIVTHINGIDVKTSIPPFTDPTVFTIQRLGVSQPFQFTIHPITDINYMSVKENVIVKDDDGTVRHTVITEKGNAATCTYNEKTDYSGTINDAISRATEEALRKD